jgi:hypothetical protein
VETADEAFKILFDGGIQRGDTPKKPAKKKSNKK